jgi:Fe-S cluster assembly iron-binding protein IscA
MIKLTDSARDQVQTIMNNSGYKNPVLKVDFAGFG